ncbi:hypothetical protein JCM10207_003704 [Rhodosporidiobolus poonsookiae]
MATQSGIQTTPELQEAWAAALADPQTRLVKVVIQDERLVPSGTFPTQADVDSPTDSALEQDFALFQQEGVVEDKVPAYYLYRLSPPPTSTFLFISFVPDAAAVKAKMITASTAATLKRSLGDARLPVSLFATSLADLSYSAYLAHTAHESADAPLTAREQEMEDIRRAEKATADGAGEAEGDGRQGRSMIFGAQGGASSGTTDAKGVLPWSDEAKEAVKALGIPEGEEGAKNVAVLEVDLKTESIVLAFEQPSDLALPPSSPCYFFYRHPAGLVVIYSCPPGSPIKSRLIYSASILVLYKVAVPQFTGLQVLKKLETDTPSEVTPAWIDSELGPLAAPSSTTEGTGAGAAGTDSPAASRSGTSTPLPEDDKPKFAKPARPGRKR